MIGAKITIRYFDDVNVLLDGFAPIPVIVVFRN